MKTSTVISFLLISILFISCGEYYPKIYNIHRNGSGNIKIENSYYISKILITTVSKQKGSDLNIYVPRNLKLDSQDTIILKFEGNKFYFYYNPIDNWAHQDKKITSLDNNVKLLSYFKNEDKQRLLEKYRFFINNADFKLVKGGKYHHLSITNKTKITLEVYKKRNDIQF
jgi:hypothetical protein